MNIQKQTGFCTDTTFYEGFITSLFAPHLVDDISDPEWQTLQQKLERAVRAIASGRELKAAKKINPGRPKKVEV